MIRGNILPIRGAPMPANGRKGIYCIEGRWWPRRIRQDTVKPTLDLLDQSVCYNTPHLHHRTDTKDYAKHLLGEWAQRRYASFPILVLAFHGKPGRVLVGNGRGPERYLELEEIGEVLAGACDGRIVHFSSCATLDAEPARLQAFLKRTRALAVSGYRYDVEWLQSAAFEILYLGGLQHVSMTVPGMRAIDKQLKEQAPKLMRLLGFRSLVRPPR
jgi:hypothetical protein